MRIAALLSILFLGWTPHAQSQSGSVISPAPAKNRIYAQILVDDLAKANADIRSAGIHAKLPNGSVRVLIAATAGPLGTVDDPAVYGSPAGRAPRIERENTPAGTWRIILPLKAAPGNTIGGLELVLAASDESLALQRATALRDRLASKIPSTPSLFRIPAPWMSQQ